MSVHAKGVNGQITVEGDWLTIERKGLGRIGHSKGDRRIPLASITAVQMRPGGAIANGFIKFTIPGSPESRGGLSDASKDENAVIFKRKQQAEFDAVREHVENYITARHTTPAQAPAQPDIADQIRKLAELRDAGILTSEEFEAKKAELLGRL
jgi:Domain of unknown function (DUF4429)/Short C-terminal domain